MLNVKKTINDFPVGFFDDLHQDFSINFQMNRFYNWTNDSEMLNEMREVSPSIHTYEEYISTFLKLAQKALNEGEKLKAAYYLRGADFYISENDPHKQSVRKQFITLIREYYDLNEEQFYRISYENGFLHAYRFLAEKSKGNIVIVGGFDSYVEEIISMGLVFKNAGYDVTCFEGPGQGAVLEDYKISFTHEWEKPVKAVLDYFHLDDVTLIGMSLGGYIAIRAAAFENRIKRVIADDICADFYHVLVTIISKFDSSVGDKLDTLMVSENSEEVNSLLDKLINESLLLKWAMMQGMHITGGKTPYEFMEKIRTYNTTEISPLLTQDVLLLAAQEDHYIPLCQFTEQTKTLTNVRSLTTRMFTKKEHAQNHCHIGNLGLSFKVMMDWIQQSNT